MKTRAGQKIRLTSVEELLGVSNEESVRLRTILLRFWMMRKCRI